jgi:hypothetical protein
MTADQLFQILKEYTKHYNKFPTVNEFAAYSELSPNVIAKVYKRWVEQEKLVKKGNTYNFYTEDPRRLFKEERVQKPDNFEISNVVKKPDNRLKIAVKVFVGFIGIILMICSVHFTFDFNRLSMKVFWAFCLSFSIVSFMSLAFTIAGYCSEKFEKGFVSFLWFLGFIYSVFTAVSGQYNTFRKYVSTDKSAMIEYQKESFEERMKILEDKRMDLLHWREQEAEYTLNPDLKTENPGTWNTIKKGVDELRETEKNIEEVRNDLIKTVEVDTVSEETVYSWLSRILKISSNRLQFIIILFPSVFIDLCSGLCLVFALSEKEGKEHIS